MQPTKEKRKLYLEVLRIFAILLVIFNHTDGFFLYYTNTDNPVTFAYSLFLSILCRVDVPLFFMISGALLLEKEEPLSKLFKKRVLRIVVVILLFSFVQYVVNLTRGKDIPASAAYFIKGVANGTLEETYWFLYAYLGILLILPFLRAAARKMKREEFSYLLLLELVMAILLPAVGSFIGWKMPDGLFFLNVNVFYMLMGYGIEQEEILEKNRGRTWPLLVGILLCMAAEALYCYLHFIDSGAYRQNDLDWMAPILAVLIFEAVKRLCEGKKFSLAVQKGILLAASCVFGIYLVERLVRILLLPVYLYLSEHSVGVVACTIYVLGTWLISFLLTLVLKQIPGIRKLL